MTDIHRKTVLKPCHNKRRPSHTDRQVREDRQTGMKTYKQKTERQTGGHEQKLKNIGRQTEPKQADRHPYIHTYSFVHVLALCTPI